MYQAPRGVRPCSACGLECILKRPGGPIPVFSLRWSQGVPSLSLPKSELAFELQSSWWLTAASPRLER